jgi:hypothetical protein
MTIAICLCVIAGSTFALFTDDQIVRMAITAGELDVTAATVPGSVTIRQDDGSYVAVQDNKFDNGGYVEVRGLTENNDMFNVAVTGMTPGDSFKFDIKVTNLGSFAVQSVVNDPESTLVPEDLEVDGVAVRRDLKPALDIKVDVKDTDIAEAKGTVENGVAKDVCYFTVTVTMAENSVVVDGETIDINEFQGAVSKLAFTVTTVQYNG